MSIGKYVITGMLSAAVGAGIAYFATTMSYQTQINNLKRENARLEKENARLEKENKGLDSLCLEFIKEGVERIAEEAAEIKREALKESGK